MRQEIMDQLSHFITVDMLHQPDRVLQPDEALLTSGLIDSFHLVDLGIFVEDKYGVRIEDFELNASTFDSLDQLVTLIETRQ